MKYEKRKKLEAQMSRSSSVLQNGLRKDKKGNIAFNSMAADSSSALIGSSQNFSLCVDKRKNSTVYYSHMFKEWDPTKFEAQSKNKFLLSNSLSKFLNFWNESSKRES